MILWSQSLSSARWFARPGVLAAEYGDLVVLLALSEGRYHTLNKTAARIWRYLERGPTAEEIVTHLAQSHDSSSAILSVIAKDVAVTLERLSERRLVEHGTHRVCEASSSPKGASFRVAAAPAPSTSTFLLMLTAMYVRLRAQSLSRVLRSMAKWPVGPADDPQALQTWCKACTRGVTSAAALLPFRARCLEMSLALLSVTRRYGLQTTLRIGVQPYTFEAHAWVEYQGMPVDQNPEYLQLYRMFPPIDPQEI